MTTRRIRSPVISAQRSAHSAQRQRPPRRRRAKKRRSHAILTPHGDEGEDRGKPTITHLLIDAPPSSPSAKKGLAFGSKPSMCVGRSAAQSVVRKTLSPDGAASARDQPPHRHWPIRGLSW